jgi:hypothetical protein
MAAVPTTRSNNRPYRGWCGLNLKGHLDGYIDFVAEIALGQGGEPLCNALVP